MSYLIHYGILGQKWGVRRYQNFDGSYTKKGLQRYGRSKEKYDESKKAYKDAKKAGNESDINSAKNKMKAAKYQMNKDYKHLEQDRLGDQGKALYAQGKRIRVGNRTVKTMAGISTLAAVGTYYATSILAEGKEISTKFGTFPLEYISTGAVAAGGAIITGTAKAVQNNRNKKLSAYYAHTSNY